MFFDSVIQRNIRNDKNYVLDIRDKYRWRLRSCGRRGDKPIFKIYPIDSFRCFLTDIISMVTCCLPQIVEVCSPRNKCSYLPSNDNLNYQKIIFTHSCSQIHIPKQKELGLSREYFSISLALFLNHGQGDCTITLRISLSTMDWSGLFDSLGDDVSLGNISTHTSLQQQGRGDILFLRSRSNIHFQVRLISKASCELNKWI